jgi:outer membrane lipoprotein-sorting protein
MRTLGWAAMLAASMVSFAAMTAAGPRSGVPLPRPSPLRTTTPLPVVSEEARRALIERINAYLSGMQTLVGDFIQIGPDGSSTDGQFYIQKPGKVRFQYNPPSPIDVIADGQAVVVRNRLLATQDSYPLSQTPLRLLLSNRLDLSKDANILSVAADETSIVVLIEEDHPLVGKYRLKLLFGAKDYQLKQWTITDPQGLNTTVFVFNLDTNTRPDPDMFKISYERALQ